MTSRNKMRKAKNSYCANALKFGKSKLKRLFFFDASQRKRNKANKAAISIEKSVGV